MAANLRFLGPQSSVRKGSVTKASVQEIVLDPLNSKATLPLANMYNYLKHTKDQKALEFVLSYFAQIKGVLNPEAQNDIEQKTTSSTISVSP